MALSFGWKANDTRESIWPSDPALRDVPAQALEAWGEDGDASHLRPYALNGVPTIINFRTLTCDEEEIANSFFRQQGASVEESYHRACVVCFRIGVDFPDAPDEIQTPDGVRHRRIVKERGVRMLSEPFVKSLKRTMPGMIDFYGALILKGTYPDEMEKKASSPPVTPMPSSGAASTTATTEPSAEQGAASGAP